MKRIVRLTESDLVRLVKKVIKEQANPKSPIAHMGAFGSGGTKTTTGIPQKTTQSPTALSGEGKHYMKQPIDVRFYQDEANTKPLYTMQIEKEVKMRNQIFIYTTRKPTIPYLAYNCGNSLLNLEDNKLLYNKNYITDLKKRYCTTSAGGTPVTNIGRYSQVGNQGPLNIA